MLVAFAGAAALALQTLWRQRGLVRDYLHIESMMAERNRQLLQAREELLHGHKMQAHGQITAGVAHDLRNLLSVISLSNGLLRRGVSGAAVQGDFAVVGDSEGYLHWLRMPKVLKAPPRIFHVNWCRKDAEGRFLWPGFGENMRVLKWIIERCQGRAAAEETPLGWVPGPNAFDLSGMEDFDVSDLPPVQSINVEEWRDEVVKTEGLFMKIYPHLPKEMIFQRELLVARL